MAGSLQDQLLNLGVANKKQAQQAKTEKRKKTKAKKGGQQSAAPDSAVSAAEQARLAREEKAARDRELNRQRDEERARRALEAEIQQLLEANRVAIPRDADVPYNFVQGTKIKRIYLTEALQQRLGRGALAIVIDGERHGLVPRDVAERIQQRDAERVIFIQAEPDPDPDDPYADYQIPDDLMW